LRDDDYTRLPVRIRRKHKALIADLVRAVIVLLAMAFGFLALYLLDWLIKGSSGVIFLLCLQPR
jgi:hypothetical protein